MKIPPCIICGMVLENVGIVNDNEDINQPSGAATFTSSGHYGSTVLDTMNHNQWLEINICDDCLVERKDRTLYGRVLPQEFVKSVDYEPWRPGDEDQ